MSRKYQENDFENRLVAISRSPIADNDSADVTSAGKSFQIRGPTTGKAMVGDSWQPDGRHYQTAIAEGTPAEPGR